jgi:hypothetical protein
MVRTWQNKGNTIRVKNMRERNEVKGLQRRRWEMGRRRRDEEEDRREETVSVKLITCN